MSPHFPFFHQTLLLNHTKPEPKALYSVYIDSQEFLSSLIVVYL